MKREIKKVDIKTYLDSQTIYVDADHETIGKIAAYVMELNIENLKAKKDENKQGN